MVNDLINDCSGDIFDVEHKNKPFLEHFLFPLLLLSFPHMASLSAAETRQFGGGSWQKMAKNSFVRIHGSSLNMIGCAA